MGPATSQRRQSHLFAISLFAALIIVASVAIAFSVPGVTPFEDLGDAVAVGDLDLARSLLAAGADPDSPRVFALTPLMRASLRNDAAMITLLIAAGADLEATDNAGLRAVHLAAQGDAVAALDELAAGGADLHAVSKNGMNTLHHAAAWGSVGVIEAIADDFDLDEPSEVITQGHGYPRDFGSTPLGIAARDGRLASVDVLLGLGADVDALSIAGHSPLLLAVFAGSAPEVVQALLEAGADPSVVAGCSEGCDGDPRNALDWARELGRTDLIGLLDNAEGASSPPAQPRFA